MKILLVGEQLNIKKWIYKIVNKLKAKCEIEDVSIDSGKYDIKYGPLIVIDGVVVSESKKLTYDELDLIIHQFVSEN